jgi:hypothetical protein
VEAGVRGQQPAEAIPGRRGSGNGIKLREKGPLYPKRHGELAISYQRDDCLRAPDRTPTLQTAESALAKRYARHTPRAELLPNHLSKPGTE